MQLTSQTVVETGVEESGNESDTLSVATDSSDNSEQYIYNDEHCLLYKDEKHN